MDRFERDFENLDLQSATLEGSMSATTTLNAPQSQVDALMMQVADEAGLELNMDLPQANPQSAVGASTQANQEQVCAFPSPFTNRQFFPLRSPRLLSRS